MAEQAPCSAQRLEKPGKQGSHGQRDEDEPGGRLHDEICTTHRLSVLAGQSHDRETEKASDRAEPADRRSDVRRKRQLTRAGVPSALLLQLGEGQRQVLSAAGAGGLVLVLLISLAVMVPLQRKIIVTPVSQEAELEAMRERWFTGNLGRPVLSVTSFASLVVAVVV